MRALLVCPTVLLAALLAVSPEVASAQMKLSPKATAPSGAETRYFTSIDGLMDGNADVILKETRQGKTVTAAVLDICYPVAKNSDRKDRFVVNLQVAGQNLTGTTQSLGAKAPVTVKLLRKQAGDTFEFRGQISIGQAVTEVTSPDNSDLSEKEFLDNQTSDDGITPQPKDFTDVSPEAIAVKVKLDAATEFLKSLKGQDVEVTLASLTVGCDALRAGEQTINMSVDPERAGALLEKFKAMPGVITAGWTAGMTEMDRTIRIPAADWRDGDKLNRDKLAAAVAGVLSRTLAAKAGLAKLQPGDRQAQAGVQAAEPGFSRARAHRHHRGRGSRLARQARHDRQAHALDRESRDHDHR
ncbi:putative membrane protein [Bradyrhizobium sp. LM6.10]